MALWQPAYMKDLVAWINHPGIPMYGMWDSPTPGLSLSGHVQPGEGGVDLDAPKGTPVYALATGPVIASGQWNDGEHQVLTQRVNVPGAGPQDLYYQHLYLSGNFQPGTIIQKGQQIGTVGDFGETEMGFNSAWGGIWGTNHPGPWIRDPRPWLAALLDGVPTTVGGNVDTGTPGSGDTSGADLPGQIQAWGVKIGVFMLALVLVGFGFYMLFQKQADAVMKKGAGLAVKAALV